ncbi:hypothetical protein FA13DRAFT_1743947 [Coprinellus micaceus]|uniref:Uncharacterized protein n=1 Tax=Coprinellus micaceus TaxID=71717 RepID=A0A4Y7SDG2_COPMI|nr:hypothetical protein FA13DRAFT_1743947 [Coprinellus micaceus]
MRWMDSCSSRRSSPKRFGSSHHQWCRVATQLSTPEGFLSSCAGVAPHSPRPQRLKIDTFDSSLLFSLLIRPSISFNLTMNPAPSYASDRIRTTDECSGVIYDIRPYTYTIAFIYFATVATAMP